uniref:Uncharacterized protein n=1 Tax=Arundo donax TaxID=35708 RepID=A0A0A8YS10_ARUDO
MLPPHPLRSLIQLPPHIPSANPSPTTRARATSHCPQIPTSTSRRCEPSPPSVPSSPPSLWHRPPRSQTLPNLMPVHQIRCFSITAPAALSISRRSESHPPPSTNLAQAIHAAKLVRRQWACACARWT